MLALEPGIPSLPSLGDMLDPTASYEETLSQLSAWVEYRRRLGQLAGSVQELPAHHRQAITLFLCGDHASPVSKQGGWRGKLAQFGKGSARKTIDTNLKVSGVMCGAPRNGYTKMNGDSCDNYASAALKQGGWRSRLPQYGKGSARTMAAESHPKACSLSPEAYYVLHSLAEQDGWFSDTSLEDDRSLISRALAKLPQAAGGA